MTIDKKPRPLPPPSQRLVETDGRMNEFWYRYFQEQDQVIRALVDASNDHETRIEALEP